MFVVQPHLDDAVLGIGRLMREVEPDGSVCVTVFAGTPSRYPPLSKRPHDDTCGFTRGDDVMMQRRHEDARAMVSLGWGRAHLGLLDAQYLGEMAADQVRSSADGVRCLQGIEQAWSEAGHPREAWCPIGVAHQDHLWVLQQMVGFANTRGVILRVWLEPGYRSRYPNMAGAAMAMMVEQEEARIPWPDAQFKLELIEHYRSQLNALPALSLLDALTMETVGIWAG